MKKLNTRLRRRSSALRERLSPGRRSPAPEKELWDDSGAPKIIVIGDTPEGDPSMIRNFKEEGFDVAYYHHASTKSFGSQLQKFSDQLEGEDRYGIVAYGEAAALALEVCMEPMPQLCALVAYYPSSLPNDGASLPPSINCIIHLAGTQDFAGSRNCYGYTQSDIGFAERNSGRYDSVSDNLAWSRTMACLREGFDIVSNPGPVWETHMMMKYGAKDLQGTMRTVTDDACVNNVPVMTGGTGSEEIRRFWADFFIPKNPPSLKIRLVSRTRGTDQIVDELYMTFTHTQEMPWILPGVPPTNKPVEIALIVMACIRGNKLCRENVYWDQASVLVQIGLLDPTYIPKSFEHAGQAGQSVERLPVTGVESARKVLGQGQQPSNMLIPNW